MAGSDFLKQKYDLHKAPEVESAAGRTEKRTRKRVSQNTNALIQNYLDRFNEILVREDPKKRQRGIEAWRHIVYEKCVIAPEDIPESAFLLEQKIARELGHGDIEITDQFRQEKTKQIIHDQQHSLDTWINYLSSTDAAYPPWAKYWAFTSMLKMGKFEKKENKESMAESAQFKKRAEDTVASFPPLNSRALAMTIGVVSAKVEEKAKKKEERKSIENKSVTLDDAEFQKLLATESFSKIYTQFLMEMPEYSTEGLQETRGKWITYKKGSAPDALVKSLDGHPLEWCTANKDTARTHLQGGDFHVYYSFDSDKNPTIPRVAIRMQGEGIAEVKGIAHDQHLDPYIGDVVDAKLAGFSDGIAYQKKSADMQRLTVMQRKTDAGEFIGKNDLLFLYEMEGSIEGFGYNKDPRIVEIRSKRKPEQDMLIIFDCEASEIAHTRKDITKHTKAYVGPLQENFFDALPDSLKHIYTSFPEGRIRETFIDIEHKTAEELKTELCNAKINISTNATFMMEHMTLKGKPERVDLVHLHVSDLGFPGGATTTEIFERAKKYGLELCPPETGPYQRLKDRDQPLNDWYFIGMEPVAGSDGSPLVFRCKRNDDGLWLDDNWAKPDCRWIPDDEFLFRRRKSNT